MCIYASIYLSIYVYLGLTGLSSAFAALSSPRKNVRLSLGMSPVRPISSIRQSQSHLSLRESRTGGHDDMPVGRAVGSRHGHAASVGSPDGTAYANDSHSPTPGHLNGLGANRRGSMANRSAGAHHTIHSVHGYANGINGMLGLGPDLGLASVAEGANADPVSLEK